MVIWIPTHYWRWICASQVIISCFDSRDDEAFFKKSSQEMETFISRNYLWRWWVDFKASSPAAILEMMDLFSKSHLLLWKCGIQGFIVWDGYVDFKESSLAMGMWTSIHHLWKRWDVLQGVVSGNGNVDFKPLSLEMDMWISSHHLWRWISGFQAIIYGYNSRDGAMEFKNPRNSRNHLWRLIS